MFGHFRNIANKASILGRKVFLTAQNMTNGSNQNLKDFTKESLICGTGVYATQRLGLELTEWAFSLAYVGTSLTLGYNLFERIHQTTERAVGRPFLRNHLGFVLLKLSAAQLVAVCMIGSIYEAGNIILPPKQTLKASSNTLESASRPDAHPFKHVGFTSRPNQL